MAEQVDVTSYIQAVEDFPKPGVRFYDCAPLLGSSAAFGAAIEAMSEPLRGKVDHLAAFDARGFLFAAGIALRLGVGLTMLRKPNKLPGPVDHISYELEYGVNQLEIQKGAIEPAQRVALVDDVIATGGTAMAGIELVRRQGGEVTDFAALIDIPSLGGSQRIKEAEVCVRALVVV